MEEAERSELIFVYGSLRRGGAESFRMVDADPVCPGLVQGKLFEISSSPALVPAESGGFVTGELYRVSPQLLEELAGAEFPEAERGAGFVSKIPVMVRPYNLGQAEVGAWSWIWTGPTQGCPLVKEGDWIEGSIPRPAPLLTIVAFICLFFSPVGAIAMALFAYSMPSGSMGLGDGMFMAFSVLSPVAGLGATYLAGRRREQWGGVRGFLFVLLSVASIPALVLSISLVFHLARSFV